MLNIGGFVSACDNSALLLFSKGELQWRLAFGIQLVPAVLLLFSSVLLPYSPRWLLYTGIPT